MEDDDNDLLFTTPKFSQTKRRKKVTKIKSRVEEITKKLRRYTCCNKVTNHDVRNLDKIVKKREEAIRGSVGLNLLIDLDDV